MKRVARHSRIPARAPRRAAGFTLIELMIAMLLGLVVMGGVVSIFLAAQQSYRANNALSGVGDSTRTAFELMARDIRDAGLTGCDSTSRRVINVTKVYNQGTTPPVWWSDWSNAIRGHVGGTDAAITGAMPAQAAGTDSLQLIGAESPAASIASETVATSFTLNAPLPAWQTGDIAIVCSPRQAAIMQIAYAGGVATFNVAGNCSTNLGYPNKGGMPLGAACTNSAQYTFPPNSTISRLSAKDWYVGANAVGGTSLYRINLVNTGGAPTPQAQEMVRNVTAMTIGYLDPSDSPIANQFVPASTITANGDWRGVAAVRVTLNLQSDGAGGTAPIARTYAFTTTLRNRVN